LGVRFPTLYDPDGKLQKSIGKQLLPVTLFIGKGGNVVHTYAGPPLDDVTLTKLVKEYL
jgi:hypothetical protein